jgi:hypothetical protein
MAQAPAEIFEALRAREPIFHRPEFGTGLEDFASMMDADFWEVGASGRIYSRCYVLESVARELPAAATNWRLEDCACRMLGHDSYLFTYRLHQDQRVSRRSTIWRCDAGQWRIIYHQGTLVST